MLAGMGHFWIASTLLGSVGIPFSDMTWPKYINFCLKNSQFKGLSFRPTSLSCSKTALSLSKCSFGVLENIMMLSRYIMQFCKCRLPIQLCINHWNVAVALVRLKGILSHSQNPRGLTVKAVKALQFSSISTCQYPNFRSRDGNQTVPFRQSNISSIQGGL